MKRDRQPSYKVEDFVRNNYDKLQNRFIENKDIGMSRCERIADGVDDEYNKREGETAMEVMQELYASYLADK